MHKIKFTNYEQIEISWKILFNLIELSRVEYI